MILNNKSKDMSMLLTLYFALKPIYLWSSGSLQIADIVFIFGSIYFIIKNHGKVYLDSNSKSISNFLLIIVLYQILVNLIWYLPVQHYSLLKSSIYYIFNFFAFFITLAVGAQVDIEDIKQAIAKGSYISIIITIFGLVLISGTSRSTGFFNNPNQLGYYAVIVLSVLLYCLDHFSKFQRVVVFLGSFLAIIASLSKAAIIGAFLLLLVYLMFYQKDKTLKKRIIQMVFLIFVMGSIYFFFFSDNGIVSNNRTLYLMRYRILNMMDENDSNLGTGRGYDRVFELGSNLLWGMGEGAYYRFTIKPNAEIHATFISILVSYGVLGFIGYIAFFWKCLSHKGLMLRNFTVMSGIILYSITHNGIRNTLLWILLAVLFMDKKINYKVRIKQN